MAYEETITNPGQGRVSTLDGSISLDSASGRLVVRDSITGQEMTRVDKLGLSIIEPDTGRHRTRVGITTTDGRTGSWTSKPGEDVRTLLGEQ